MSPPRSDEVDPDNRDTAPPGLVSDKPVLSTIDPAFSSDERPVCKCMEPECFASPVEMDISPLWPEERAS